MDSRADLPPLELLEDVLLLSDEEVDFALSLLAVLPLPELLDGVVLISFPRIRRYS